MDQDALLALYDRELRRDMIEPGAAREVTDHVVRMVRPKPERSFIEYFKLDESNADAVIVAEIEGFLARNLLFTWKVFGHDRPSDMIGRLAAHGLAVDDEEAIMVLDLADLSPRLGAPVTADVRRLTDPAQLVDVVQVLEAVYQWGFSWVHKRLGPQMGIPDYLSVFVAYVDERPAGVAWVYYPEGHFATLWAGATLEEMRGRGLYTALLAARLQEARARGKQFATLDAGPMSRPIVARHGFIELTTATDCRWIEEEIDLPRPQAA
jgi:GNAT superfamily N-acetyltransferase